MRRILSAIFLIVVCTSLTAQVIQSETVHKDLILEKGLEAHIMGNSTTAHMLRYYSVPNSREFIRRENFKLTYFNEDGSVKWKADLADQNKLNTSEIIVATDADHVYAGMFSGFFGSKDHISIYTKDGKFLKDYEWDFPFKVAEKLAIFSDEEGFHVWIIGNDNNRVKDDSKYYMVTFKGSKVSYIETEKGDNLKGLLSDEIIDKIDPEEFKELKLSFKPSAMSTYQTDIPENDNPYNGDFRYSKLIYLKDKTTEDHVSTLFVEFSINGKGIIKKEKEFIIDNNDNGKELMFYNAPKKEYVYVLNRTSKGKEPLVAEVRILDNNGKVKATSLVMPSKFVTDEKQKKNINKTESIVGDGTITTTNVQSFAAITITNNQNKRMQYDPFTGQYVTMMNSSGDNYILALDESLEVKKVMHVDGFAPICRGSIFGWTIGAPRGEVTHLAGDKSEGMYENFVKAVPEKERKSVFFSLIPNTDGTFWLVTDNEATGELKLSLAQPK